MKTHLFTLCAGLLISLSSLVSATACAGSFSESQLQKRETLLAETSADEKARYAAGLTEVLRATEDEREQHRADELVDLALQLQFEQRDRSVLHSLPRDAMEVTHAFEHFPQVVELFCAQAIEGVG